MTLKYTPLRKYIIILLIFSTSCNRIDSIINDKSLDGYVFTHFEYERCRIYDKTIVEMNLSGVLIVNSIVYPDTFYTHNGKKYYPIFHNNLIKKVHPNDGTGSKKIILPKFFGQVIPSKLTCSSNRFDGIIFFDEKLLMKFLGK